MFKGKWLQDVMFGIILSSNVWVLRTKGDYLYWPVNNEVCNLSFPIKHDY